MKKTIYLSSLFFISFSSFAQIDTISSNIYQENGKLGIGISSPSHLLSVSGEAKNNKKEELARFSLMNDSASYLLIGNSTYDNNYYVPSIKGYTAMPYQPGLVLRGMAAPENDNSGDALIHITPYILDGENLLYPTKRHYLGIQGYETGVGQKPLFEIDEKGFIGIGTDEPYAKLQISDGDIYIKDIDKGIIMKSTDSSCWRGVLDNTGSLNFTQIDCPESPLLEVQELKSSDQVNIFPNPVNETVTILIKNDNSKKYVYSIYDINGVEKGNGKINNSKQQLDISGFTSGCYFVIISDKRGNLVSSNKIIKE